MSQASTAFSHDERKAGGRRLLCFGELKSIKGIPYSRQWIAELIRKGKFPRPVKPGAGCFNAWFSDEIDRYLDDLAAARDGEAA